MNKNYLIIFFIFYFNGIFAIGNSPQNIQKMAFTTPTSPKSKRRLTKIQNNNYKSTVSIPYEGPQKRETFLKKGKIMPKMNGQVNAMPKRIGQPISGQKQRQFSPKMPKTYKKAIFNMFEEMNLTSIEQNFSLLDEKIDENYLKKIDKFEALAKLADENGPFENNLPKNNVKNNLLRQENSKTKTEKIKTATEKKIGNLEEHRQRSKPILISKIFRLIMDLKNRAQNEKQKLMESPKDKGLKNVYTYLRDNKIEESDSVNSEDDELLSQLSEDEGKNLLDLAPELKELPFFKTKSTKILNKIGEKNEKKMKYSIKELKNYYDIVFRSFKIKFKQLVDQNEQFVEEMLAKESVIQLVEKYLAKLTL